MTGELLTDSDLKRAPAKEPAKRWRNRWRVTVDQYCFDDVGTGGPVTPVEWPRGDHWGLNVYPSYDVAASVAREHQSPEMIWLGAFPVESENT